MPWFKENRFYFYIIMLLLLIMAVRTPIESDMWWHLRAGEQTWLDRQVYSVDTFSFTREGSSWINHSWLAQVLMYILFQTGGYLALSIWVALAAVFGMAMVYFQMDGHPLLRGAILILAGATASVVWSPRPQIMSLALFGLVSYILYLYKWKKVNRLAWLLPVFLVWGNLHGGYALGLILIFVMIAGELINQVLPEQSDHRLKWRELGVLGIWAAAVMIVVLVNPFGIEIWKIPFSTVGVKSLQDLISEWSSPDFHQLFQQPMLWMLFLVLIALGKSKKEIDGTDLVSLIVFSWLAFTARRNFGPFAMISAPVISRHLSPIIESWKLEVKGSKEKFINHGSAADQQISISARNWINLGILLLLIFAVCWKAIDVSKKSFVLEKESEVFPFQAVENLLNNGSPGKIFNEYNWGGYLIWHLRDYQVFVDGRTDLFGDEIIGEWSDILNAAPGWEEKLKFWQVDYILVRSDRPLLRELPENWELIFSDQNIKLLKNN